MLDLVSCLNETMLSFDFASKNGFVGGNNVPKSKIQPKLINQNPSP